MKRLLFLVLLLGCYNHERKDPFQNIDFAGNYDADTVTINLPSLPDVFGKNISVRVLGIDAPEIKGKTDCESEAAVKAKEFVYNLLTHAERIDLINVGRDKYFRILADILVDNSSLGQMLINKRLAVPYDGGHKDNVDWCPSIH